MTNYLGTRVGGASAKLANADTVVALSGIDGIEGERTLAAGGGIDINDGGAGSTVTISATTATTLALVPYVTMSNAAVLDFDRVLTAGTGISITDGGANGPVTVSSTLVSGISFVTVGDESASFASARQLTAGANVTIGDSGAGGDIIISATGGAGLGLFAPQGRLTLTTGTPVTTSNVSGASTVYYTPHVGDQAALYDGVSAWDIVDFSETSIDLDTVEGGNAASASSMYAIYAYNNGGTFALEAEKWTNTTTRATALTYQDGFLVKTGATTRLHLGDIYITSVAGDCEDSDGIRGVSNRYNRVARRLYICPGYHDDNGANTYTFTLSSFVEWNGGTGNTLGFISNGDDFTKIDFHASWYHSGAGKAVYHDLGIDSTSAAVLEVSSHSKSGNYSEVTGGSWAGTVAEGFHTAHGLARTAQATATQFADVGRPGGQAADAPASYLEGLVMA